MISDIIRKLNHLMIKRSKCKTIQSCLNVIADGLEFIFQTKNQFDLETKFLFEDEQKNNYFTKVDTNLFEIQSLIFDDDLAIQCLFQLYQFYELHSETINQHIGENHVSVLFITYSSSSSANSSIN